MKLAILGSGGHGRVVASIAVAMGYDSIAFYDDNTELKDCVGTSKDFLAIDDPDTELFVAIGDNETRMSVINKLPSKDRLATLIHPSAIINAASIGKGTVIMPVVVINAGARIGEGCIINTNAVVEHDCIVEDYSHISVSAVLAGTVRLGKCCFIGAGAVVINNINICDNTTIGAGAAVVKDITMSGIYIGTPARLKSVRGGVSSCSASTSPCREEIAA